MDIVNLNLDNGYSFEFDKSITKTIYFGPNSIGKTTIAKSLNKFFEESDTTTLNFADKIMDEMIFTKKDIINIAPRGYEIYKIEEKISKLSNALEFNVLLKNLTNNATQKFFADLGMATICEQLKQKSFLIDSPITNETFDEKIVKAIFEKHGNYNLLECIKELSKSSLKNIFDPNVLKSMPSSSVVNVQKEIIENNYIKCPVCNGLITDESLSFIKSSLALLNLDDDIKNTLIDLLDNSNISDIVLDLLSNFENLVVWNKNFAVKIENSIIKIAQNSIKMENVPKIKELMKTNAQINEEIKEFKIDIKSKDNKTKICDKIKSKLLKNPAFANETFDVTISSGLIKLKGLSRNIDTLSTSERNLYTFVYFDALVYAMTMNDRMVNIIIDDPFDSYDVCNVNNCVNILCQIINSYDSKIGYLQIFSHSLDIFKLYKNELIASKNINMVWLDKDYKSKNILQFSDNKGKVFLTIEHEITDIYIAKAILERCSGSVPLIVASIILRNLSDTIKRIGTAKKKEPHLRFYKYVTQNVIHYDENNNKKIAGLSSSLTNLYKTNNKYSDKTTIRKIFENQIDENSWKTYDISIKGKTVDDNELIKIMIFKYALAVKCRREIEKYLYGKYYTEMKSLENTDKKYQEVGEKIKALKDINPNDAIIFFFEENKYFLNCFCHSMTKFISPIFVFSLEYIQNIYIKIKQLTKRGEV